MREWTNSSLGMYVDDGILFAASEEWGDVERLLTARYAVCEEWLRRSGLAIKLDKTELLFFQKPYERNAVPVTDLQGPPSERTQSDKIRDLKSLAKQYARDQGSCDDTRISYLEYVESEAEADWTLARMIAG
jgi:hypothetical protein